MKIMLPIDGSDGALEAVRYALGLVHAGLDASFVLANVQEPASLYEMVTAHNSEVIEEVSAAAAEHSLVPAQAMLRAAGVEFETEIGHGSPGQELVAIAERYECDAVIIGARGMDVWEAGSLGSVANEVLRHSRVPVTVIKRHAA